ncbi:hypothetical protein AeRB84_010838 [Aphanomyces euteiches]|nr:hypothetical protein AeRB84_010838 [Aphanomyces euteiches]
MTAVLVLSTSSVDFKQLKGAAFMSSNDRPFVEIALLAGESTWVVYVLNDLLLPVTTHLSSLYAPLSSLLAFILTSAIASYKPFQMTASITRSCSFKTLLSGVVCTSGKVFIGSFTRACILVAVQLGCVVASYAITVAVNKSLTRPRVAAEMTQHVAIPAASDAFFATVKNSSYNLDNVSCVMSGIIPAFGCVFDVKLWTLFQVEQSKRVSSGVVLRRCALGTKKAVERILSTPTPKRIQRVWSILGLIYMGLSISGSYAFLRLTETPMMNDFWWTSFDLNNTQSYLCNWFNTQLTPILYEDARVHLNDFERALLVTKENTTDPNINIAPAYAHMIQDEVNSLPNIILALRNMNGCDLPWIFTGYCFLDFNQTWELANSNARQKRCRLKYASNGAVYLESLLRNNREFSLCWSEVLDTSIFAALRESNNGLNWIDGVFTSQLTIQDEAAFWHDHGIHYYSPQWQNFKSLGVIETMDISTALGTSYPLTLKKSNGTLQLSKQTSYKMYWGLAGDLAAIVLNGSTIHGRSLVRQASNFAFQNTSIEVQLINNLTLRAPLTSGMTLVRTKLGPFGSIDMYNVAMPLPLLQLYKNLTRVLVALLASSSEAQPEFWPRYASTSISAQPSIWDGAIFWGGNVMCPEQLSPLPQALIFFSSQGLCTMSIIELMELTPETSFQALIATRIIYNMTRITSIQAVCQRVAQVDTCANWLKELKSFSERHITSRVEMELAFAAAQTIKQSDINLQLFQYISRDDKVILMSTPGLFDVVDFEFFSWIMLFEWARGLREAVTFQGDLGSLTLMSTKYFFTKPPADSMEVPLNFARYVHRVVQYFTLILLCVALTMVLYIFHSRGFIQASISFLSIELRAWSGLGGP